MGGAAGKGAHLRRQGAGAVGAREGQGFPEGDDEGQARHVSGRDHGRWRGQLNKVCLRRRVDSRLG
eukprot:6790473-Prymnesium_polylepis.2